MCALSGHELSPLGTSKDNGWACDGRDEDAGCLSKITGFRQTKGMNRSNLRLQKLSGRISLLESLVISAISLKASDVNGVTSTTVRSATSCERAQSCA